MFSSLSEKITRVLSRLKGQRTFSAEDIRQTLSQVRLSLLEADVSLSVVKSLLARIEEQVTGQNVLKGAEPGHHLVKIVHDALVETLAHPESFSPPRKGCIMIVGLQGSGKTTFTAKLALWLTNHEKRKVLMSSVDAYRPAAQEQLFILGKSIGVDTLSPENKDPLSLTKRAKEAYEVGHYDILLLDTAGRLHCNEELMQELESIKEQIHPALTLFVADSMTGQDAIRSAKTFHDRIGFSGTVLSRVDGDSRGGAALSIVTLSQRPIWFLSKGEKPKDLELFDAKRVAGRILGMGDIVGLVEKVSETIEQEDALALAQTLAKGTFTLNDLEAQLLKMQKLGNLGSFFSMIPGLGTLKSKIENHAPQMERQIRRQVAIIRSMTPKERLNPDLCNPSRKKRIAQGSGTQVSEVNRLLKQHAQMASMMKKFSSVTSQGPLKKRWSSLLSKRIS